MDLVITASNQTHTRTITCTSSLPSVGRDEPLVLALISSVETLHQAVPLRSLKFYQQGAADHFLYEIDAVDNRKWKQDLYFASPDDRNPGMKFSVTHEWKLSEFSLQRPIRDYLVTARSLLGMTSVIVNYVSA